MSAAADVAAWLGAGRDATLMSYLLPAGTPAAAIRAALARAAAEAEAGPAGTAAGRRDALLAAGSEPDGDAEDRAIAELRAVEPRFRALAAWALGRLATPAAVAALGAALGSERDPLARQAALRALGAAGPAANGLAGVVGAIAADEAEPEALRALALRVAVRLGPAVAPEPDPDRDDRPRVAPEPDPAQDSGPRVAPEIGAPPGADRPAGAATSEEPAEPPAGEAPLSAHTAEPPASAAPPGPRMVFGQGDASAPDPEPPPADPLLAALVAIRPGLAGAPLRARVVHALALQGFAIEADLAIPDRGDGRPGTLDLLATRGTEAIALVLADELPSYPALLALAQAPATARGVVLGASGLAHVPEFADWLIAGGRYHLRGLTQD